MYMGCVSVTGSMNMGVLAAWRLLLGLFSEAFAVTGPIGISKFHLYTDNSDIFLSHIKLR